MPKIPRRCCHDSYCPQQTLIHKTAAMMRHNTPFKPPEESEATTSFIPSHPSTDDSTAILDGGESTEYSHGPRESSPAHDSSKMRQPKAPAPGKWARLGVFLIDAAAIAVTFGLLAFVCVIAAMSGRDLDSRYSLFSSILTTVSIHQRAQHIPGSHVLIPSYSWVLSSP